MTETTELVARFYDAFARRDATAMGACYASDAHFSDPVFPDLHGSDVTAMWSSLLSRAPTLTVSASEITAEGNVGHARWDAHYLFSRTGRPVHNIVQARMICENGLIREHHDDFSFWRWSRQALGVPGVLLGWSPFLQRSVQKTAAASLKAYLAAR